MAEDSRAVWPVLVVFCAAIPAWVVQSIAVRPFYARGDTWRPMLLGTGVAALAIPLYATLGPRFGTLGLACAGALAITANALATLVLARSRHGAPELGTLAGAALRALLVGALCGACAHLVSSVAVPQLWQGEGFALALAKLVSGALVFGGLALPGVLWLGDAATRDLVRGLLSSVRRRAS